MNQTTSITRPADTNAYATGDVLNANGATTPIEIDFPFNSANLHVFGSHLISSNEASTSAAIDLYFYSKSFAIAADNAAFAPTDAQAAFYLGKISHSTWTATAANKNSDAKPINPIALQPCNDLATNKIYCIPILAGSYTPISGEVITIKLDIA